VLFYSGKELKYMEDNLEQLQEVKNTEIQGTVKCPSCGSGDTVETGSYVSSRDQCMVFEYRCSSCGHVFEING
jgi:transposase-like protein